MAMEAQTRQVIAFYVGDRSRDSAKELWAKIPLVDCERAIFHTDHYDAYTDGMPAERHNAITKDARKTIHIEPFNKPLRQRVARLVREPLSFSKKLAYHIGAIQYFVCHYKLAKAVTLPV